MTIDEEKQQLRATIRRLSAQLPFRYREAADRAIARHLLALPEYRSAGAVFCFVSAGREIDTRPILEQTLADGKMLCVPLCVADGIMELRASYHVYLLLPVFGNVVVPMEESCRVKGWTGYERAGFLAEDEETVYITETGMVYHRDYHCNYLELSARMVPAEIVEDLRNESQGKYYPCERCAHKGAGSGVYITDYGDRYHTSLSCSGLKRTIYAVPLSEAVGKGACSKCG